MLDISKEKIAILKDYIKKKPEKTSLQFFRYLIAGGTATLVDMGVLFVLYHLASFNYLLAAAIGYSCGILTNFTINVFFVFESSGRMKKEFVIFASVGIFGLLWTELILWIFSDQLNFPVMLAKIVAVIFVLFWNFFMRKKLVFKK